MKTLMKHMGSTAADLPIQFTITETDAAAIIEICNSASPSTGVFGTAWGKQALANVQRMAVDEEYRKSISKNLS